MIISTDFCRARSSTLCHSFVQTTYWMALMSSLRAFLFCRSQRRPFTLKIRITSTAQAMGRKKVIGQTSVSGEVPLSAFQSYGRCPRTALGLTFKTVFQPLKNLSLLLVLKEDPPSSILEEKRSEQLGLPQTLQQEFSLINVQIRNVNVEVLTTLGDSLMLAGGAWWARARFQL